MSDICSKQLNHWSRDQVLLNTHIECWVTGVIGLTVNKINNNTTWPINLWNLKNLWVCANKSKQCHYNVMTLTHTTIKIIKIDDVMQLSYSSYSMIYFIEPTIWDKVWKCNRMVMFYSNRQHWDLSWWNQEDEIILRLHGRHMLTPLTEQVFHSS